MRREFRVAGQAEPISHFTDAVQAGDLLFVSGIVPVDERRELVGGDDVVAQARCVFENMRQVLAAACCTFADVVKVTLYLTDVADRPLVNPVRQEVFGETRPASTRRGAGARHPRREAGGRGRGAGAVVREEIHLPARPVLSHSADAVRAGGLLFVAGILPVDAAGGLVGGDDVGAQAEHVFAELGEILAAGGCGFADVARVNVFLTDVADRPLVNPVRQRLFGEARPASTLVEVSGLAVAGARIEVDAVAVAR